MKKIKLIIQREYLSRVKKKTFIIMTILGPILMAAMMIVPVIIAKVSDKEKNILVLDETDIFHGNIPAAEKITFTYKNIPLDSAKMLLNSNTYYCLLHIPKPAIYSPETIRIFSLNQPSLVVKSYLDNVIKKEIEARKLATSGINTEVLNSIKTKVDIITIKIEKDGSERRSSSEIASGLAFVGGFLIYIFIFMYGAQVMRGVIEEKTNRIVEVIVSSVKPFQLMMGKIIGVAMVGLTQFVLWIVLTFAIVTIVQAAFPDTFTLQPTQQFTAIEGKLTPIDNSTISQAKNDNAFHILSMIYSINLPILISFFIFYFIGGYLLYAALFAAIGAAVDNETDTQQFLLPITIPLILSIVMISMIISNPDGPVAFWFSIIPLTSPVIMMARIPFKVPFWDLGLSVALLIIGFLFTTWLAAKIYRTGILMYGKKVNYRELWKWLTYKR